MNQEAGQGHGAFIQGLRESELPFDLGRIQDELMAPGGLLDQFNVKAVVDENRVRLDFTDSSITRKGRKATSATLQEVLNSPRDIQAHQADVIKRNLQDFTHKSKAAKALVHKVGGVVKDQLHANVPDYQPTMAAYDDIMTFLNDIDNRLNINLEKGVTKSASRTLNGALREGREEEVRGVSMLEERTGLPIEAQVAGQQLSQTLASSLTGRQGLLAVTSGSVVGGMALDPALAMGLLSVPVFSPRFVGKQAARLGVAAAKVQQIEQRVTQLLRAAQQRGIQVSRSMTIGQLEERLNQPEQQQRPSLLGIIGRTR